MKPLERDALEAYSRLWDELDSRLGEDNPLTKKYVKEYQERSFEPPIDSQERARVQMMRASFVMPRSGVPDEVCRALLHYDLFERER